MKHYQFTINACAAEKHSNGMVFQEPFQVVHREDFTGTLNQLAEKLPEIDQRIKAAHQFEANKGYSVNVMLSGGQRKPAGYDARRRSMAFNYIAA